jgi:aspartate/methionine/tyrosine aminotransferase
MARREMALSARGQIDPFIVMDVMARASALEAAGRSIMHLEVGQPGTAAPKPALAAVAQAAAGGAALGYTVALGLPALREAVAALYLRWYGLSIPPERIVITAGASGAFVLAFSALFDAGQRVALGEPGYPSYRQILRAMSLAPVGMPTSEANRYQPTPDDLAAVDDLRGLILASPANPSGTMLSRERLAALVGAAQERGLSVISDEIYHGLDFGAERAVSALEVSDDVYVVNSFSKYFSMTGYRIGWLVVPQSHVRTVERLAQNLFICPPHVSQVAALAALAPECVAELEANRAVYAENRRLLLEALPRCGFSKIAPPDGAFYIYADVGDLTENSLSLCAEILNEAGVAITPGLDFDPVRGSRTVRFSYARATKDIAEALRRLEAWFAARAKASR